MVHLGLSRSLIFLVTSYAESLYLRSVYKAYLAHYVIIFSSCCSSYQGSNFRIPVHFLSMINLLLPWSRSGTVMSDSGYIWTSKTTAPALPHSLSERIFISLIEPNVHFVMTVRNGYMKYMTTEGLRDCGSS